MSSYKRVRFFWKFKFIFSCVRTDVKMWLQNLWHRYRKFPVKLEISVNFWYCFGTQYMLFCLHVHATDFILVSILSISFLYLHFSLPCFHGTCSIFSVGSNSDSIWVSFYGSTFAHFSYSLRFWFSTFNISLLEILFSQGNKQA